MVKMKAISRDRRDFTRERKGELMRVSRNPQPELHPFERAREYTRAVNAVKLDRHFAKPFVGALSGHADSVHCMAKSLGALSTVVSGGADGELRRWNLAERSTAWSTNAHSGFVRGLAFCRSGHHFVSASDDCTVKLWSAAASASDAEPLSRYLGRHAFKDVDHHWQDHLFATAGAGLALWDSSRSEPLQTFAWGADGLTHVRFNPSEHSVLGCLSSDRSLTLYDVNTGSALQKMTMQTQANALCWNPMEPFHVTLASEDHNLYTFDIRKLDHAICVHRDHVSAVMALDYSPTGTHFVSGSYDRTLRIWEAGARASSQVYHAKRMQRLFCVTWSADASYVLSGSDDTNVRLWRAVANEGAAPLVPRERRKREYAAALVERHKHLPEVRRVKNHKHVPKSIKKAAAVKETVEATQKKREKNRRAHSKPGAVPKKDAKKKKVWKVHE